MALLMGVIDTSRALKRYESALQITLGCKGNFGLFGNS